MRHELWILRAGTASSLKMHPSISQTACIAWLMLFGTSVGAFGQLGSVTPAAPTTRSYDIPSQDIGSALSAYSAASGLQVLYETSLIRGRVSNAVNGTFAPISALQKLLVGTGLTGRMTDIDAVTISQDTHAEKARVPSVQELQFIAGLQRTIIAALCQHAETRQRQFRIAVQLWTTEYGTIRRATLLGSTGDLKRDDIVAQTLQNLTIDAGPPPGMPQPLTFAISPRKLGQPPECEAR